MTLLKLIGHAAKYELIAITEGDQMISEAVDMTSAAAIDPDYRHANLIVHIGSGKSR
jgi:hypothetical protein